MHQMDTSREDLMEAFMSIWLKFREKFLELRKGDSTKDTQKKLQKIDTILRSIDTKDLSPKAIEILDRMKADTKEAANLLLAITNEKKAELQQNLSDKINEFNELEINDPYVNSIKNSTQFTQPNLTDEQKLSLEKIIMQQYNSLDEEQKQMYSTDLKIEYSENVASLVLDSIEDPGYSGFTIKADINQNELTVGGWSTTESKGAWVKEDYVTQKVDLMDLMEHENKVSEQSEVEKEQVKNPEVPEEKEQEVSNENGMER